ncbi:uncharacterized protein LOC121421891 [Lytechinus variegatus]|uniref:uncharacterized protein LOC121421891 n=1 Tax=Lytechinus variegatus TaxID=7654 RepID=UPI001BB1779C|nr:uncharacterized protein LOC121421891 [Lytechinus variegatus]
MEYKKNYQRDYWHLRHSERDNVQVHVSAADFGIMGLQKEQATLISQTFPEKLAEEINEHTTRAQLVEHHKTKERHLGKFSALRDRQNQTRADLDNNWRNTRNNQESSGWVRNLSSTELTDKEVSVSSKGLNFAVTPQRLPITEIITATESAIHKARLDTAQAEELRHTVSAAVKHAKLPAANITAEENSAIEELNKNTDIAIVPADKGRCLVVLDKSDYENKCLTLLKDKNTYRQINYNPTNGYRKKTCALINSFHANGDISEELERHLTPATEPTVPAFYGLPKIHKPAPIPVRPIVSSIDSVTYNLAKFVARILSPLVGNTIHHIQNTDNFVEELKTVKLDENETIVSFDVSALFTSIPVVDAITVVRQCLIDNDSWKDRTKLNIDQIVEAVSTCLHTTYFSFKGVHYIQKHGCAMGSPVSPIVANLYMQDFEQKAISSYPGRKPRTWLRYVDDTFVIIHKSELHDFFKHINNQDVNIKFTQEACKDNKLAFLDCEVQIVEGGSLDFRVYRKPTHTNQYLHFNSHHPLVHKLSVIRTLFHRADSVVSKPEDNSAEKKIITNSLGKCGYPSWAFQKATRPKQPRPVRPSEEQSNTPDNQSDAATAQPRRNRTLVTIPYVAGLSERISRTFGRFGISTSHKPHRTLRQLLVHVKDQPVKDKKRNVVYGIRCEQRECQDSYIGETQQSLRARMYQHRKSTGLAAIPESAVFTHLNATGHTFNNKDVVILDKESRWFERGVKEAIWERVEKPTLNRRGGLRFQLSHAWDRILREVQSRLSRD